MSKALPALSIVLAHFVNESTRLRKEQYRQNARRTAAKIIANRLLVRDFTRAYHNMAGYPHPANYCGIPPYVVRSMGYELLRRKSCFGVCQECQQGRVLFQHLVFGAASVCQNKDCNVSDYFLLHI